MGFAERIDSISFTSPLVIGLKSTMWLLKILD